ncbi:grasp-with-spasm system ATP-grasp peptide maturase [Haliscomenobacter sp.]|uniref:grasp-with-spasm system ATP-grasp peptide maturase n=1 Tax=Haliscomenobacter sp. TaxID=2717303 RepID=UPI00359441FB
MILIKSIADDFSTTHIIKWLEYFGVPFLRINDEKIISFSIESGKRTRVNLENEKSFVLEEIQAYWYRRGMWKFKSNAAASTNTLYKVFDQQDTANKKGLLKFLNESLKLCGDISDQNSAFEANKLDQLRKAEACGIPLPEYLVTTQKSELLAFLAQHSSLITKALTNAIYYVSEDVFFPPHTLLLDQSNVSRIPDVFAESLFQTLVLKKYEIRSFYFYGKFYSMAIFSQNDDQTKVDFRNYNWKKPNRNVPYQLPVCLEEKLQKLMELLQLQSGSFDLIVTPDDQYVFLEVNPVGQFGMVSIPCNYGLEKLLAEHLAYGKQ